MGINVTRPYKLGKKKEVVEAWLFGEMTTTEAAKELGTSRQNFGTIVANITRHMVSTADAKFSKAFYEALNKY